METEKLDQKQDAELESFEEQRRRSFERGKTLVWLIAGINILFDIITILISHEFQLIKLVIHVALSAALVYGVAWVRYLYAAVGILTVVVSVLALPEMIRLLHAVPGSGPIAAVLVVTVGYSAATAVILLFCKSVQEYMYGKQSERY